MLSLELNKILLCLGILALSIHQLSQWTSRWILLWME